MSAKGFRDCRDERASEKTADVGRLHRRESDFLFSLRFRFSRRNEAHSVFSLHNLALNAICPLNRLVIAHLR